MMEDWQKPSKTLERIADGKISKFVERCPNCPHHSHPGEMCGTQIGGREVCLCRR